MHKTISTFRKLALGLSLLFLAVLGVTARAQETTGTIQGTITDPSGAVVADANVEASSPTLGTPAKAHTDSHGFYRLNALPPGTYTVTVTGAGMTAKATRIQLKSGDLPNINLKMVPGAETVIDVTDSVAMVDVTQSKVETVVTQEQIDTLPKGRSFQSLLTLAPGVRQEPLQSLATPANQNAATPNAAGNANIGGGSSRLNGFQIDGASDSENVYLLDGVNITNIQGGGIGMNVPTEFIGELSVKSGAIEAQYGGALGGVINIVPARGTSAWHGSLFLHYRSSALDANDQCTYNATCFLRVNPTLPANASARLDRPAEYYIAKQDHYRYVDPGFRIGGPLGTDKLRLFAAYAPDFQRTRRDTNSTAVGNAGLHTYYQTQDVHFANVRLDYAPTSKLRVFGGWDYSYIRLVGAMPNPDSKLGQLNSNAGTPAQSFRPDIGFVNPIAVYSFGADYTLTSKTLFSARYGYLFNNTHTLGTASGLRYTYNADGTASTPTLSGATVPTAYQNTSGFASIGANQPTSFNAYKRKGVNLDLSHLLTGFAGTHAVKAGYSFTRTGNAVKTLYDYANVQLFWGSNSAYTVSTTPTACDAIIAANVAAYGPTTTKNCTGNYGYFIVHDGTDVLGSINSNAHGLYIQDDWTVGHSGLTINAGVRFDREYVPPYAAGDPDINFGWGSKIAPRIGGAYDLLHNGKVKIFASYGKFYDILKFSLPQGSFGGNYWHDCAYTLDDPNYNKIQPTAPAGPDGFRHSCGQTGLAPGVPTNAATDTAATGGANGRFIENIDFRAVNNDTDDPGVQKDIKPTAQHETEFGVQWAASPSLSFNARYVRKSLDSTTEDIGITDTYGFYIGNPGTSFADVLHRALPHAYRYATQSLGVSPVLAAQFLQPGGVCPQCPTQPTAIRTYNGLEFRVEKRSTHYYATAFYTFSHLYGNYPGLTSTFITDGSGGRHNPNNNRSFDLPHMQFTSHGKPFGGPLPTDRPHSLTIFGSYRFKTLLGDTSLGLTQIASSGSPVSTCLGMASTASSCQFVEDQGGWVNFTRADASGTIGSAGVIKNRRTPVYTQTGFNFSHYFRVSKDHENRRFGGEFNVFNVLNQHAVMGYNQTPTTSVATIKDATNATQVDYNSLMRGYDYVSILNGIGTGASTPKTISSLYGLPNTFQAARQVRFKFAYTF